MKIHFRTYCYGCRRGKSWDGKCIWRSHRFDWEYYIECNGRRLIQRTAFKTMERARKSAERSWRKLIESGCLDVTEK